MEEANLRILVTGAEGNLGGTLVEEISPKFNVFASTITDLDITKSDQVNKVFKDFSPQMVIHTAAMTNVDGCEINPEEAQKINSEGTKNITKAANKLNAAMIYISTDHVFDGKKNMPYKEDDKTGPINIYGKTKLMGEEVVQGMLEKYFILRSSWLFGKHSKTFIEKIIEKAKKEKTINIVNPKYAAPTYVNDLAKAIAKVVNYYSKNRNKADLFGIYHITNSGCCSWLEYAKKILEYSRIMGVKLIPVSQEQFGAKAKRPAFSVLDNAKYNSIFQDSLRSWQEALKEYLCIAN